MAGKPVAASLRVLAPPGLHLAVPRQVYTWPCPARYTAVARAAAPGRAALCARGRRPAREIATHEPDGSEWSISKPGQAPPPPTGTAARPHKRRVYLQPGGVVQSGLAGRVLAFDYQAPPPPTGTAARPRWSCAGFYVIVLVAFDLLSNFARNSPATVSRYELKVLKLQRFRALLKVHAIELRATLGE